MKSKFKYFGKLTLLFITAPVSLCMPYLFASGTSLTLKDDIIAVSWFSLLITILIAYLWKRVLNEVVSVEILQDKIVLKNEITGTTKSFRHDELQGLRHSYLNDNVQFKNYDGKVIFTLAPDFYLNFEEMMNVLNKQFL